MAVDPSQLVALTVAIPELTQLPQCALPAFGAIAAAGCGPQLDCICSNDHFFLTLQGVILQGTCTVLEAEESLHSTRDICTKAVPWLADDRGPVIVVTAMVLSIIATITFFMRCVARRLANLRFGWDDWLILVSLIWAWGVGITACIGVYYGCGKHMLMLDLAQITAFAKTTFVTTLVFPASSATLKLSILLFYHRIFPMARFRLISIIIGLITMAWLIASIFLAFFTCIPLAYFWDRSIPNGHCINLNHVAYYGTSPPDILTNFAILLLPIPYLWNLQMRMAKKVAVTGIFLLGSFAAIGSVIRVPMLTQLKPEDLSYSIVDTAVWILVECDIGIISACLPMLRPLFSKTFPSTIRSKLYRSRTGRYGTGSQRLDDMEKNPRSSKLGGSTSVSGGSGGAHAVGNDSKAPRAWYNAAATAKAKGGDTGSEGSQEEMVPMGKIAVRHEVDWEASDKDSHVTGTAT